jgi:phage FluMu gp28-like protein
MDEASRCKEESWHALYTTLTATRGQIRVIGNVKGRKNWAYRLARKAQAGAPGYSYAKITADDAVKAGILTQGAIDEAREALPENVFRELYYAEASDDEGNPFGFQAIRKCIAGISNGRPIVFGLDIARSRDWMVLIGLDAQGYVCYFDRWQGPANDPQYWEKSVARTVTAVGNSGAVTLVDATSMGGDHMLEALRTAGRKFNQTYLGYVFSAKSKQSLMEGLAMAIQQATVHYPDGFIVDELETFEYEYRRNGVSYTAPEGLHDDCVCSLALAVWQYSKSPRLATEGLDATGFGVVGSSKPFTIEGNV